MNRNSIIALKAFSILLIGDNFVILLSSKSHFIFDYYSNLITISIAILTLITISAIGLILIRNSQKYENIGTMLAALLPHFFFKTYILTAIFSIPFSTNLNFEKENLFFIRLLIVFGFLLSIYLLNIIANSAQTLKNILLVYLPISLLILFLEYQIYN